MYFTILYCLLYSSTETALYVQSFVLAFTAKIYNLAVKINIELNSATNFNVLLCCSAILVMAIQDYYGYMAKRSWQLYGYVT